MLKQNNVHRETQQLVATWLRSDVLICVCSPCGPRPPAATFKRSSVSLAREIFGCHMKAAEQRQRLSKGAAAVRRPRFP
ncbi:hypothetical protein EXN66_Car018891 [Channa argus]|uniref:Uncharacterized protein n=1 Tax=Channa argus TaxID=215402 RepID=A0A6G1QLL5_CHAAH|nr:hypothetical protein EXN66_Car018891 [Channa argus]